MRIIVSNQIKADHELVKRLVREGFEGVDSRFVEVHIKARKPRVYYRVMCYDPECELWNAGYGSYRSHDGTEAWHNIRKHAQAYAPRMVHEHGIENIIREESGGEGFSGRAYSEIPSIANVAKSARYLITLTIPHDPESVTKYPYTWHYSAYKTAPEMEISSWQADLIHLVAHEAKHIEQFREGLPRSEVRCEYWAAHRLAKWLGER